MPNLSLSDLKLVLDDVLGRRATELRRSTVGASYEPILKARSDAIAALPKSESRGEPLATELEAADHDHALLTRSLYETLDALVINPRTPAAARDAAIRVRDAFVPDLSISRKTYTAKAAEARERRVNLAAREFDLRALPVPGGTLYDWVVSWLDTAESLDTLLSQRSGARHGSRAGVASLRASTQGLMTRLRAAIDDEAQANPALADLDARVFGYYDEICALREAGMRNGNGAVREAPALEAAPAK